jgi:uncharacterized protein YjbI with pentapeptide repeats
LTLAGAILVAGAILGGALAWLGLPKSPLILDTTSLLEIIKISLAVVAGIGGAVALVVAYRKQRLAEEDNHRAREQNERAKEAARREDTKLYAERFDKATDKLGADAAPVRLAGVHALAALADDWEGGRQTCIDVLCAYLRMPPDPEPDADQEPTNHSKWQAMREVRATIVRLIATHLRPRAPISWSGTDMDFTGVIFDDRSDFHGAVFSGGDVSFRGAKFSGGRVLFRDVEFSGGDVSFYGAEFSGSDVSFSRAKFSSGKVSFYEAKFSSGKVSFDDVEFSGGGISFNGAKFSGGKVLFVGTKFSGGEVSFNRAHFSGGEVSFYGAEFSGGEVSFRGAMFSGGEVSFLDVKFSGGRVSFNRAEFSGGEVLFRDVKFSDGRVSFNNAEFSGSRVSFDDVEFSGGEVLLNEPGDWSRPPIGLPDQASGLRMPPNRAMSRGRTAETAPPM